MPMRIAFLMPVFFIAVQLIAQQRTVVRTDEEYKLFERDARLGLTKALLENDLDSIRYWRDVELHDESRRRPRTRELIDDRARTVLNFHLGDVKALLEDIQRDRHYFLSNRWKTLTDVVLYRFSDSWVLWTGFILDQIGTADIGAYEKELLTVYWMKVLNDVHAFSYGVGYSLREINARANSLLDAQPDHPLAPFIREHIRWEYQESPYEFGYSAGAGATFFTDELTPLIDPGYVFHARGESFRSRLQLFGDMEFRSAPAASQFLLDTVELVPGDRISWFNVSMGGGLVLLDGNMGRVILSAGVQMLRVSRPVQDTTFTTGFFFQPVSTLTFDLKVGQPRTTATGWRGPQNEWRSAKQNVYGIRLSLGYTPDGLAPSIPHRGGMFMATLGVVVYTRAPVRIR